MRSVSFAKYSRRFAASLAAMVASEASSREDPASRARFSVALDCRGLSGFDDVLAAAKAQTLGYAWQNCEFDVWSASGHEAVNFGAASGPDGFLCGRFVSHKISRPSGPYRHFSVSSLPDLGSDVVNMILFASSDADMGAWRVFVGTTDELAASAEVLCGLSARRRATVSTSSAGDVSFSLSYADLLLYSEELPGFMSFPEYVKFRSAGCACQVSEGRF